MSHAVKPKLHSSRHLNALTTPLPFSTSSPSLFTMKRSDMRPPSTSKTNSRIDGAPIPPRTTSPPSL
ncbi:unnamed protein product [Prunus armeniaca]|uniref:Uncharacterized protein n=1 Tax=Prunus armeniaca TaxID=36596 RepID=A0A6J5U250_PRUAR|nr:unnamed protein product [Prunus armeniaca]